MSHTTVDSNKKENRKSSATALMFYTNEKTLEVPPTRNVNEVISTYVEDQGNIELEARNAILNEKGQIIDENSNSIVGTMDETQHKLAIKNNNENVKKAQKTKASETRDFSK